MRPSGRCGELLVAELGVGERSLETHCHLYPPVMSRVPRIVRAAALLTCAAVAVHELRFAAGFGDDDAALANDEHAYLGLGLSLVAVLLLIACGLFARSLREARRAGTVEPGSPPGFVRTWVTSSAALSLVYTGQELIEPAFAAGHPGGLTGVLGHAGWAAFLFAVALGAVVALLLRGARAAIVQAAAGRRLDRRTPASTRAFLARYCEIGWPAAPPLALHLAGRAPPLFSR